MSLVGLKWRIWDEGTPFSTWAPKISACPQPWGQGPSDADASEYSMPYLPATSNCRQLFCTDVVIWSYTTFLYRSAYCSCAFRLYGLVGTGSGAATILWQGEVRYGSIGGLEYEVPPAASPGCIVCVSTWLFARRPCNVFVVWYEEVPWQWKHTHIT